MLFLSTISQERQTSKSSTCLQCWFLICLNLFSQSCKYIAIKLYSLKLLLSIESMTSKSMKLPFAQTTVQQSSKHCMFVQLFTFLNGYALETYNSIGHVSQSNRNRNLNMKNKFLSNFLYSFLFAFAFEYEFQFPHISINQNRNNFSFSTSLKFKCQTMRRKIRIFVLIITFLTIVFRIQFYANCESWILASYCFKYSTLNTSTKLRSIFRHFDTWMCSMFVWLILLAIAIVIFKWVRRCVYIIPNWIGSIIIFFRRINARDYDRKNVRHLLPKSMPIIMAQ